MRLTFGNVNPTANELLERARLDYIECIEDHCNRLIAIQRGAFNDISSQLNHSIILMNSYHSKFIVYDKLEHSIYNGTFAYQSVPQVSHVHDEDNLTELATAIMGYWDDAKNGMGIMGREAFQVYAKEYPEVLDGFPSTSVVWLNKGYSYSPLFECKMLYGCSLFIDNDLVAVSSLQDIKYVGFMADFLSDMFITHSFKADSASSLHLRLCYFDYGFGCRKVTYQIPLGIESFDLKVEISNIILLLRYVEHEFTAKFEENGDRKIDFIPMEFMDCLYNLTDKIFD